MTLSIWWECEVWLDSRKRHQTKEPPGGAVQGLFMLLPSAVLVLDSVVIQENTPAEMLSYVDNKLLAMVSWANRPSAGIGRGLQIWWLGGWRTSKDITSWPTPTGRRQAQCCCFAHPPAPCSFHWWTTWMMASSPQPTWTWWAAQDGDGRSACGHGCQGN